MRIWIFDKIIIPDTRQSKCAKKTLFGKYPNVFIKTVYHKYDHIEKYTTSFQILLL